MLMMSIPELRPERDEQISSTQSVLGLGGFGLKYMVYNGRTPRKLLGYKSNSELDVLYPGFVELNLNKRVRGAKKANLQPVITLDDAGCHMNSVILTLRMVELYDPSRFWEPWKLQLKLLSQSLAGMDWNEYIPAENQDLWKLQFSKFVDFLKLSKIMHPC